MRNYLKHLVYINKLSLLNQKRSYAMLKIPFQYKKINIDEVKGPERKRAKHTAATMKRIGSYLLEEKWLLTLVIVMVITSSGLGLLGPYLVGMAIDDFIVTKKLEGLALLLVILIIIYAIYSLAIFLQNYWMIGIGQKIVYTL